MRSEPCGMGVAARVPISRTVPSPSCHLCPNIGAPSLHKAARSPLGPKSYNFGRHVSTAFCDVGMARLLSASVDAEQKPDLHSKRRSADPCFVKREGTFLADPTLVSA